MDRPKLVRGLLLLFAVNIVVIAVAQAAAF